MSYFECEKISIENIKSMTHEEKVELYLHISDKYCELTKFQNKLLSSINLKLKPKKQKLHIVPQILCEFLELEDETELSYRELSSKLHEKFKNLGLKKGNTVYMDDKTFKLLKLKDNSFREIEFKNFGKFMKLFLNSDDEVFIKSEDDLKKKKKEILEYKSDYDESESEEEIVINKKKPVVNKKNKLFDEVEESESDNKKSNKNKKKPVKKNKLSSDDD
jgi:hypothetical protein